MSNDSTNVRVGVSGSAWVGLTTATAPTSATSTLTGFTELGYISEDGLEETRERSTNKIKAWQNAAVVREVVTDASATFKFTCLEASAAVLELYYGSTVDTADGSIDVVPSATGGRKSFVFNSVDGDKAIRIYVPQGEVTSVEAIKYVNGDPVSFGLTVTAYSNGSFSYKRFQSDLVD